MKKLILLVVMCIPMMLSGQTPGWKMFLKTDNYVAELDTNNVKRCVKDCEPSETGMRLITERLKILNNSYKYFGEPVDYIVRKLLIDCADSTFIEKELFLLKENGELIHAQTITLTKYSAWDLISSNKPALKLYLGYLCREARPVQRGLDMKDVSY